MCASEGVLLNLFQNTGRRRKLFEGRSTRGKFIHQKRRSPSLHVKRPAPFIRIREAMWF
jgi:hypothetical protein